MLTRTWPTPVIISGLLLVYGGLYVWQPGGSEVLLVLTHTLFAVGALLAAGLILRATQLFERGVPARRVWLFFGAGMTVLTVSESLWLYDYFSGRPTAYPSAADVSWAIGFIPVLASLVLHYRALGVQISRRRKLTVLGVYLVVLALILIVLLGYVLSNPGHVAVMQLLIIAYYLIGDFGVAYIATLSLVFMGQGLVSRPWQHMVVSILLFAVAGLEFSYGVWTNTYATGSNLLSGIVDVAYLSGYLMAAAGGYRQITL
ncbi:MAG: hypothetical protein HY870_13880, partial [Chloroflexi bacterium]|nr:hypothetical protein [Chloroflexota bacterium]